jgi:hypothetical protein
VVSRTLEWCGIIEGVEKIWVNSILTQIYCAYKGAALNPLLLYFTSTMVSYSRTTRQNPNHDFRAFT